MNIVGTNSIRHAGATTARPWSSLDDPSVGDAAPGAMHKTIAFLHSTNLLGPESNDPDPGGFAFGLLCGLEFSILTNKLDFNFGRA